MTSSRDRRETALAHIADPKGEGARAYLTVYTQAARESPEWVHRSIDALGEVAHDGDCETRIEVARELGQLGEAYGRGVLDQISAMPVEKRGGISGVLRGDCDPTAAARSALEKLAAK